jgi:hypothetical protein
MTEASERAIRIDREMASEITLKYGHPNFLHELREEIFGALQAARQAGRQEVIEATENFRRHSSPVVRDSAHVAPDNRRKPYGS